jgi:hypothetical protein
VRELGVDLGFGRWVSRIWVAGLCWVQERERELGRLVELDVGSTGFKVLRGRESVVGVGKGVGFPVGGGGDSGEGEIWEMGNFLKMNLNELCVFKLFCLKKKNEKQLHVKKRRKRDGQKAHV